MRTKLVPDGVEVIARDLDIPWSMEFSSNGRLYFTERPGKLKVLADEETTTLLRLDVEAKKNDEGGLLGMTLSPNFKQNKLIYLYYTYRLDGKIWNRVSSFKDMDGELIEETIVFDGIPGGRVHNGGRIKFGPDEKLYITTGDIWQRQRAQDLSDLGGKILRVNEDGTVPNDNPFTGSPIYSYGNRNPQGLAWHPVSGDLFSSEHGPSGENDWRAHDEVNIITPGGNYGWPKVIGSPNISGLIDPLINTGDNTWAPSGICFYTGDKVPTWMNCLMVANLRGNCLQVIYLEAPDFSTVKKTETYFQGSLGRLRDVLTGPDGYLYLCTNNNDGRGIPITGDDVIIKVTEP